MIAGTVVIQQPPVAATVLEAVITTPANGSSGDASTFTAATGTATAGTGRTLQQLLVAMRNGSTGQYLQADDTWGAGIHYRVVALDTPGVVSSTWSWTFPVALTTGDYKLIVGVQDDLNATSAAVDSIFTAESAVVDVASHDFTNPLEVAACTGSLTGEMKSYDFSTVGAPGDGCVVGSDELGRNVSTWDAGDVIEDQALKESNASQWTIKNLPPGQYQITTETYTGDWPAAEGGLSGGRAARDTFNVQIDGNELWFNAATQRNKHRNSTPANALFGVAQWNDFQFTGAPDWQTNVLDIVSSSINDSLQWFEVFYTQDINVRFTIREDGAIFSRFFITRMGNAVNGTKSSHRPVLATVTATGFSVEPGTVINQVPDWYAWKVGPTVWANDDKDSALYSIGAPDGSGNIAATLIGGTGSSGEALVVGDEVLLIAEPD